MSKHSLLLVHYPKYQQWWGLGRGASQHPEMPLRSPRWVAGTQRLEPSPAAFPVLCEQKAGVRSRRWESESSAVWRGSHTS